MHNIDLFQNRADAILQQDLTIKYDDLIEKHNALNEKFQAITNLYIQATSENAEIQKALEENLEVDTHFAEGFDTALEASKKENGILLAKIVLLESRERENSATYESRLNSVYNLNKELEDSNSILKHEINAFELYVDDMDMSKPSKKFIDYCAKISEQAENIKKNWRGQSSIPLNDFKLANITRESVARLSKTLMKYNHQAILCNLKAQLNIDKNDPIYNSVDLVAFCKMQRDALSNFTSFYNSYQITQLPSCIDIFVNLTSLSLGDNQLQELPSQITTLTKLTYLCLSNNDFKSIPKEIYSFINLEVLTLRRNKICNLSEDIGNLTKLATLHLDFNDITTLPQSFEKLISLRHLNLFDNKSFVVSPVLTQLRGLEELKIEKQPNACSNITTQLREQGVRISEDLTSLGKAIQAMDNCLIS